MAAGTKRVCGFGVMRGAATTPAATKVKINADTYFCRACVRRAIKQLHKGPAAANRPISPQLRVRTHRACLCGGRIFFGITPQKAGLTPHDGCRGRFTRRDSQSDSLATSLRDASSDTRDRIRSTKNGAA
jgi:hypothetical protein